MWQFRNGVIPICKKQGLQTILKHLQTSASASFDIVLTEYNLYLKDTNLKTFFLLLEIQKNETVSCCFLKKNLVRKCIQNAIHEKWKQYRWRLCKYRYTCNKKNIFSWELPKTPYWARLVWSN